MAKTWADVVAAPGYADLPPERQESVRNRFFEREVAPKVAPEKLSDIRAKFDSRTKNTTPGSLYAERAGYGLEKPSSVPIPLRADVLDNVQDSDITVDAAGKRAAVVNGQTIPLQAGFDEATDAPQYIARTGEAKEPKPLTGKKLSKQIVHGAQTHPMPDAPESLANDAAYYGDGLSSAASAALDVGKAAVGIGGLRAADLFVTGIPDLAARGVQGLLAAAGQDELADRLTPIKDTEYYRRDYRPRMEAAQEIVRGTYSPETQASIENQSRESQEATARREAVDAQLDDTWQNKVGSLVSGAISGAQTMVDNPRVFGTTVGESLPQVAVGGAIARALAAPKAQATFNLMIRAGASKQLASSIAAKSVAGRATAGAAGSEALSAATAATDTAAEAFDKVSDDELLKTSPELAKMVFDGDIPIADARDMMRSDLMSRAAAISGAITATAGKVTGASEQLGKLATRGLPAAAPTAAAARGIAGKSAQVVGGGIAGAGKEGVDELLQEGGDAYAQNEAAIGSGFDPNRSRMKGVAEQAGAGMIAGMAMGGPIGAANATTRFWQKSGVNAKLGDRLAKATEDRAFKNGKPADAATALDAINDVPDAELQEASARYKVLRTDGGLSEKQAKDIMREDIAKAMGVDEARPGKAGNAKPAPSESAAPAIDDVFASYDEPAQPERAPEPGVGLAGADAGAGASDLGLREPVTGASDAASVAGSERSDAAADTVPVGARDAALGATDKESLTVGDFVAFPKESGTLGIPRAEMPQVKAEHRGALTNFLNARGIAHDEEAVDASTLKPTQAEYSPSKVQQAKDFKEGDRAVLVSADGHIVDGHHQAIAAMDKGQPIRIIRLDAPIKDLLPIVKQFPSAAKAVAAPKPPRAPIEAKGRQGTRSTKEISETLKGDADLTQRIEGLAAGAGWATMGGERIPNAADGETARHFGQDERVRNIDRMSWDGSQVPTTWEANPGHEWFRHHQNRLPNNADGSATKEAVRKAAAGELMKPAERRHVDELIRIAKGERTAEGDAFSDQMIEALTQHGGLNPDIEENHTDADVIAKAFSIVGEDEADAANSRYDSDIDLLEWAQGVVDGQQRTQEPAGADREGAEPQQGQEASREQGQREGDGRQAGRSVQGEVADEYAPAVEADRKGAAPKSGNDLVLPDRKEPGSDTPVAQKAPAADAVPKSAKPEAKPAASEKPTPRLDTRPLREIKVKRLAVTPSGQQLETTQRADLAMKEIDGRIASVKALIRCLSA